MENKIKKIISDTIKVKILTLDKKKKSKILVVLIA